MLPEWRTVYISVPKAACTSLKWLIADVQGESRERFHESLSREVTRAMCVHRRDMWRHTPMLHELPPKELDAVTPDNGWFVFAVVRHPAARLWSGWQSKFLLQEPKFMAVFGSASWVEHSVPTSTEGVVDAFRRFVLSIGEDPDQPVRKDRHFLPQVDLLRDGITPYTRVYRTDQMPALLGDFDTHLRGQGWEGTLHLSRHNEAPLRPVRDAFAEDAQRVLLDMYSGDYQRYGYDEVLPGGLEPTGEYDDDALSEIARLVERAERVNDLAMAAQELRSQLTAARNPRHKVITEAALRRVVDRVPDRARSRLRAMRAAVRGS